MKIKNEHYEVLETACKKVLDKSPNAWNEYKNKGLSEKRFRWDVLWATKLKIGDSIGMPGDLPLYDYMNDEHIDTALRKIVQPYM